MATSRSPRRLSLMRRNLCTRDRLEISPDDALCIKHTERFTGGIISQNRPTSSYTLVHSLRFDLSKKAIGHLLIVCRVGCTEVIPVFAPMAFELLNTFEAICNQRHPSVASYHGKASPILLNCKPPKEIVASVSGRKPQRTRRQLGLFCTKSSEEAFSLLTSHPNRRGHLRGACGAADSG